MASAFEIIDGHLYWVTRDDNGNIIKQECRDATVAIPPVTVVAADIAKAITALSKSPATATLADVFILLQLIAKQLITR